MKTMTMSFNVIVSIALLMSVSCVTAGPATQYSNNGMVSGLCIANPQWVESPRMPVPFEVPNGTNASLCNFDQFSWQVFLVAMQPRGSGLREFQNWMPTYGVYKQGKILAQPTQWGTIPNIEQGVCPNKVNTQPIFFSNLNNQAGSGDPLIDQAGNYTYYQVSMNNNMYQFATQCGLTTDNNGDTVCTKPINGNIPTRFPPGAIELKTAWKVLTNRDDPNNYHTVVGTIKPPTTGAQCQENVTLGLVGFHLVTATELHPEMLWATFENIDNAPNCQDASDPQPAPYISNWSYNNPSCAKESDHCSTNTFYPPPIPTQVCTAFAQGGGIPTNVSNVISLNTSVQQFIRDPVMKNYLMGGNIWTNNGTPPSVTSNQRGSLFLSNNVLETYTQPPGGGLSINNCFGCHSYTDTPVKVSHMPRTTNP